MQALALALQGYDGIIVVGLAGPSGAGKTVFSTKVRSFLPGTCHLQMDMYNDGTKVVDNNFDDPRLTDYDTLLANIADLRAGKTVQVRESFRRGPLQCRAHDRRRAPTARVEGVSTPTLRVA